MEHILEKHRRIWDQKKIIRVIYTEWYRKILRDLYSTESPTVELGAGGGNFKEFKPDVIAADVVSLPWLDMSFDAHHMPFEDNSLGNIVMIDVLHHLSNPVLFLDEAARTLKKEGRLIMLEPYPSSFSLPIYRRFHPEPFFFDVDYFSKYGIEAKDPWESNQAIPYLLFYKDLAKFLTRFAGKLKIIQKEQLSFILYPASGGFENKALIPDWMIPAFQTLERMLTPLRAILAFRCYLVIEKI